MESLADRLNQVGAGVSTYTRTKSVKDLEVERWYVITYVRSVSTRYGPAVIAHIIPAKKKEDETESSVWLPKRYGEHFSSYTGKTRNIVPITIK